MHSREKLSMIITVFLILNGMFAPVYAQILPDDFSNKVDAYITETMRRLPIPGLAHAGTLCSVIAQILPSHSYPKVYSME